MPTRMPPNVATLLAAHGRLRDVGFALQQRHPQPLLHQPMSLIEVLIGLHVPSSRQVALRALAQISQFLEAFRTPSTSPGSSGTRELL